jgi:SAM-dependent methyltransferase
VGIDSHAFNFIRTQSLLRPLGDVLTIGRQELYVDRASVEQVIGRTVTEDTYCEPVLKALGAENVNSIDFSDYESPTYVCDLSFPVNLDRTFDTVIDSGSLEHIFDVAQAFRNLISFARVGGRIIHILPVNNLNGHGFWQFSSDLLYTLYSLENGFENTTVYYASGLNSSEWREIPVTRSGQRTEAVSIEPLILLSVTEKVKNTDRLVVLQPFYHSAWSAQSLVVPDSKPGSIFFRNLIKAIFCKRGLFLNFLRNGLLIAGLALGTSRFSIKRYKRVSPRSALPSQKK